MLTILLPLLSGCVLFDDSSHASPTGRGPLADIRPTGSFGLVPCTQTPPPPSGTVTVEGKVRRIAGNGMPGHDIGAFPNPGNPHTIAAQSHAFTVPTVPSGAGGPVRPRFGVAVNGIPFDAGTAEFWQNDRSSGWQYEALSGAINLGVDCNRAHVQPGGVYHYHGIPEGLVDPAAAQMQLVGYGADGYPVYSRAAHAVADDPSSPLIPMASSYRLKEGKRPDGRRGPGGTHDGTFVQDYAYTPGAGDLDACNGRVGHTPDHGETYYYVLTDTFPFVPRCTHAAADASFRGHGGPPGGPGGRPPPPRR